MSTEIVKRELNAVADHLETHGHAVGKYFGEWKVGEPGIDTSPACLVGAFYLVRLQQYEPPRHTPDTWFARMMRDEDPTAMALDALAGVQDVTVLSDNTPTNRLVETLRGWARA